MKPLGPSWMFQPVIDIKVEPRTNADWESMLLALQMLIAEDPRFSFRTDEESGETIISGTSELHLDGILDRLKGSVAVNIGAPNVAYREAITKAAVHDYAHKKQTAGGDQFAHIRFRIEPNGPDAGFAFASEVPDGNLPEAYVDGVRPGVELVMQAGPVIGFPIVDLKFTLLDGAYHDVDSSVLAFEIAARAGVREAIEKAAPKILEPIMAVEVVTPEDCVGGVIEDLLSRRGQVDRCDMDAETRGIANITGLVPLATMFGYVSSLRAMTQGRARYTMIPHHYEQVPMHLPDDDGPFGGAMAMRA